MRFRSKGIVTGLFGAMVLLGAIFSFLTADVLDDGTVSILDKLVQSSQEDETTEPSAEIVVDGYELA